jgi:hypothetical protein
MLTLICTAKFDDGKVVKATVRARTQFNAEPVEYSGPIARLDLNFDRQTAGDLEWTMRDCCKKAGAKFHVERQGSYDKAE